MEPRYLIEVTQEQLQLAEQPLYAARSNVDFPEPPVASSTTEALQASDVAGGVPTPVSVSPAGVGALEVAP